MTLRVSHVLLLAAILVGHCPTQTNAQENWPRFRGNNGDGISKQTRIPSSWSTGDYEWNIELPGSGHSSPVVWGNDLFITAASKTDDGKSARQLVCLNADNGETKWIRTLALAASHLHEKNSWASGTPATDGKHVYVAFADTKNYTLAAYSISGDEAWSKDLGSFTSQHGQGSSPIVVDDLVVIPNDQMGPSQIVALNKLTGDVVWKTDREFRKTSYATPIVVESKNGRELVCVSGATGVCGFDLKTGKMTWQTEAFPMRTVASPIMAGGLIYASCGSGGQGKLLFGVDPTANTAENRVRIRRRTTLPYVPTPVEYDGRLYLWTDGGIIVCINPKDGNELWRGRVRGKFSGSPICVDGRLFCISESGDVVVVEAGTEFKPLARTSLGEPSYATPAVAGGKLYLRTFGKLMCLAAKN